MQAKLGQSCKTSRIGQDGDSQLSKRKLEGIFDLIAYKRQFDLFTSDRIKLVGNLTRRHG